MINNNFLPAPNNPPAAGVGAASFVVEAAGVDPNNPPAGAGAVVVDEAVMCKNR